MLAASLRAVRELRELERPERQLRGRNRVCAGDQQPFQAPTVEQHPQPQDAARRAAGGAARCAAMRCDVAEIVDIGRLLTVVIRHLQWCGRAASRPRVDLRPAHNDLVKIGEFRAETRDSWACVRVR